jgi:uncharacterized protein DUF4232
MSTTTRAACRLARGEAGMLFAHTAVLVGVLLVLAVGPAATQAKSAVVARCATPQLRVSLVGSDAATSHRYWNLALENRGTSACRLQGYPGVGLVGRSGGLLPVDVRRVRGFARPAVDVPPGGRAYFTFGYVTAGPCGTHAFTVYGLQIIPPDERTHLVLRRPPFAVCDVAVGGSPVVYPVRKRLTGP